MGSVLPIASVVERDRFVGQRESHTVTQLLRLSVFNKGICYGNCVISNLLGMVAHSKRLCTKPGNSFTVQVQNIDSICHVIGEALGSHVHHVHLMQVPATIFTFYVNWVDKYALESSGVSRQG